MKKRLKLEQLQEKGYFASQKLVNSLNVGLNTRPCPAILLTGYAGSGKTFLAETVASLLDASLIFWQGYSGADKDDIISNIQPDESTKSGFKQLDGKIVQAAKNSQTQLTVLILDEWDKTRPSSDSFLLDFLQNGRISKTGSEVEANLNNLLVFITSNDERPFSLPLQRRVNVIHFDILSPEIVRSALNLTHFGHVQLEPVVRLYEMALQVRLERTPTIQELRQLLDACMLLGEQADWDELVFQFVTKENDAHVLLKSYSSQYNPSSQEEKEEEAEWNYPALEEEVEEEKEEEAKDKLVSKLPVWKPKMKRMTQVVTTIPLISNINEEFSFSVAKDKYSYTRIIKENIPLPTSNPSKFGEFEVVSSAESEEFITMKEPLKLNQINDSFHGADFFIKDQIRVFGLNGFIEYSTSILHYTKECLIVEYESEATFLTIKVSTINSFNYEIEIEARNVNISIFKKFFKNTIQSSIDSDLEPQIEKAITYYLQNSDQFAFVDRKGNNRVCLDLKNREFILGYTLYDEWKNSNLEILPFLETRKTK